MSREAWLSGPIEGIPPLLMPVAHSLVQAKHDLHAAAHGLTDTDLWHAPGGAASIGFHLRHIPGTADRLMTYAVGRSLSKEQFGTLAAEKDKSEPLATASQLLDTIDTMFDRVIAQLRVTPEEDLVAARYVGRAKLPSTVIGLLFHIAEHTQRHTGQVITTAKIIRGTHPRT